jgi:hypothetical protein
MLDIGYWDIRILAKIDRDCPIGKNLTISVPNSSTSQYTNTPIRQYANTPIRQYANNLLNF